MHPPTWLTTILLLLSPLTTALATAVFPVHAVSPRGHLIAPRQDTNISSDKVGCGRFSTANHWDVSDLLDAMHASTQPDDCTTPVGTCRRVACVNTSGVYVCNDTNDRLMLSCGKDMADLADWIFDYCCRNTHFFVGQSGQIFNDTRGYNGCGPPGDPWGPNGVCRR